MMSIQRRATRDLPGAGDVSRRQLLGVGRLFQRAAGQMRHEAQGHIAHNRPLPGDLERRGTGLADLHQRRTHLVRHSRPGQHQPADHQRQQPPHSGSPAISTL
jgi:hypothetical protein